jgi:hypothetical protein
VRYRRKAASVQEESAKILLDSIDEAGTDGIDAVLKGHDW